MLANRTRLGQTCLALTSRYFRNLGPVVKQTSQLRKDCLPTSSRWPETFPAVGTFIRHLSTTNEAAGEAEEDALYKKLIIEVGGHDPEVLRSYESYVTTASKLLEISLDSVETPPKHIHKMTMLKSVHIYKKHRVQYEMRTHFKIFNIKNITGSTADTFLEYIQRNLPEGVSMKVTKHRIERLPEHIKPPTAEPELAS
ncbi:small ribosomal subunit protein uS10m-like [Lineus longissimus]|uniref:small ribosomal subunit protein uS10m-like n=1 Tax=Lineus longissimus TaxID=88925 RepID=UPI002B4C9234